MPSTQVTGQLVDPTTGAEGSADIRIASMINYGQTTKKSISHKSTDASGNYDFQLVYGKHLIFVKYEDERIYIPIGYAVVGDSTPDPVELIQLINLSDENPPSELVTELQQLREDTLNDIVDTSAQVLENAGYQGEWISGTSTALKGETWQVSGRYYVALKNTSVDPINDNDNWREDVTTDYVTIAQNDIVGGSIFKGSNGDTVENGEVVEPGTTHLRVLVSGEPAIVAMSPTASGTVSLLTDSGATIGGTPVSFDRFMTGSILSLESRSNLVGTTYIIPDRGNAKAKVVSSTDVGGIYIGSDITGNKLKLIYENKLKTSWFGDGHDAYKLAMSAAVDFNLDLDITEYRYDVSETFVIGAPDGQSYDGVVSCNIYVEPTVAITNVVEFRNFNGKVGEVWANAIGLADVAINKVNSARMQYDKLRGRRGKRWAVVVDSSTGNNSGSVGSSLRAENSGSNISTSFTYVSDEGPATPSQRSNVVVGDEVNSDAVILVVGDTSFFITDIGVDNKSLKVHPAIPSDLQAEVTCKIYQGGGVKYKGSDTGVCNVDKATVQSNFGVGVWMSSLYGQCYSTGVFELNHGPDIVCGSTTTGFSAKNTITSGYFESSRTSDFIVMLSKNSKISILDAFNLPDNSVKNLYDYIVGVNGREQNVTIMDDDHAILRHPFKYLFDIAGTTTLTLYQAESQFLSSNLGVTSDFNLVLKSLDGKHRDTKTEFHFYKFVNRDIVITDQDGGTINGQASLRVTTPGSGVLYLFRDRYDNANKWIATLVKSDI